MKKQILSGILTCSLLMSSAAAAFTDISDSTVQQAAGVLDALEIMQGVGNNRFNPTGALTRAQFCKLAVTSLGMDDVSAYQGFTVFPDMPAGHWATGYVNAAVKDAELSKKQIIRGFADGTFRPNQSITYAEACTMLLRMLGYGVTDVGAFWPQDYIAKAESLGMREHVKAYAANDTLQRGDAAVMLLNALQATPKEGNALLYSTVSETKAEDSILLATSETDSDLTTGQAQFFENGTLITRRTTKLPDQSLIGQRGTVLFDKENDGKVIAFLPDTNDTEVLTTTTTNVSSFDTTNGKNYKIANDTPVVINGEIRTYAESYFDLANKTLQVYYDADSKIELIVRQSAQSSHTFVYGTATAANIPSGYTLYKNGTPIGSGSLAKYDLITLDAKEKKAYASDSRVTGYLREASPTFSNPSKIKVLGQTFTVSDQGAAYFRRMQYNDKITLLLDENGIVCAAYPAADVSAPMIGQYVSQSDGTAAVDLLNGIRVSGNVTDEELQIYLGRMVQVSEQKDATLSMSGYHYRDGTRDIWDLDANTIGSHIVSNQVRIFEALDNDSDVSKAEEIYVSEIHKKDILTNRVPANKIRSLLMDSSGTVTAIFLDDYTGDGWQYGMASISSSESDEYNSIVRKTVSLKTYLDGEGKTVTYNATEYAKNPSGSVIGLPKDTANVNGTVSKLPVKKLEVVGQVSVDAFDGETGVRTSSGYYPLEEDAGVYVADYGKMIALREAKSHCSSFTLYADTDTPQGGKIRVIVGK